MGEESSPMELEHMIGFSTEQGSSVQFHPTEQDTIVSYIGCLVIIANVNDPHQQEFLRGHTEEITTLSISSSGKLLASGQTSSTRFPTSEASIIVWHFASRQKIYCLSHLSDGTAYTRNSVLNLAFSPDEAFLAGCDDEPGNAKLCVWDMHSGSLAAVSKQKQLSFLCWGATVASTRKMSRHDQYTLYGGLTSRVSRFTLEFDVHKMQHTLKSHEMAMPSSGLGRDFHCAKMHGGNIYLVTGTSAGELCVFNTETMVYRACVPVSCGGLLSLACKLDPQGRCLAFCGCGDGKIKVLVGQDQSWSLEKEASVPGKVRALTLSADGEELLAGTDLGDIWRLSAETLAPAGGPLAGGGSNTGLAMASHTSAVHCMAFGDSSETFASGSADGVLRVWELSHYQVCCHIQPRVSTKVSSGPAAHATCLVMSATELISGWTDGFIRCHGIHGLGGDPLWEICNAHRAGVCSVAVSNKFTASGGEDGTLRLWSAQSRSLVAQFAEHRGAVTSVLVDNETPHLIHSCSDDKTVVTVDLKQERRVVTHKVREGQFRSMVQTNQGDRELLTADHLGAINCWDCDQAESVATLVTWRERDQAMGKEKRLNHISLSPPIGADTQGGDFLVASTASGEVQVWELARLSAPVAIGVAHSHEVMQAAWSPDGRQVVSVAKDKCICIWNWFRLGTGDSGDAHLSEETGIN